MVISPDRYDLSTILHTAGRLIIGLGMAMLLPLCTAVVCREINPMFDYLISFLFTITVGIFLTIIFPARKETNWIHAFFTVSFGWLVYMFFSAIPLYFSGHFHSFLDACFEAMSGLATTGLSLAVDLDHMSYAHNIWRHFLMFIGGQGIVVASLAVLTKAGGASFGFYVGEGRSEKIFPNVIETTRFIWKVSLIYLIVGALVMAAILNQQGMHFVTALYHGFCLFCAGFDTGGFGIHSQNVWYYHSVMLEIAILVIMLLGAFNFNLHYWVWMKKKSELWKNFEMQTFLVTIFSLTALTYFGFKGLGQLTIFRKGFFQVISAHTGTGFTNVSISEMAIFHPLVLLGLIFAMMLGGAACSTTGGIKLIRVGLVFKGMWMEIKHWVMPSKAVYSEKIHHLQDVLVDKQRLIDAYMFSLMYILVYVAGGVVGIFCGYDPLASLFESVSAAANVGLSVGITAVTMPVVLKVTYILQMWAGRLEFLSIFVALGFVLTMFKK